MAKIETILKPLNDCSLQSYLGTGLHTLGLLRWILKQTGRADVYVSTFSTSEEFLSGFHNLRMKGLIAHATLLADLKACRKTVRLNSLMNRCFDTIYLGQNHSKVVLVQTDSGKTISVISSQNQTYGGRAETTVITTCQEIYHQQFCGLRHIVENNSIQLNGLFNRTIGDDREAGTPSHSCLGNFRPFGYEE